MNRDIILEIKFDAGNEKQPSPKLPKVSKMGPGFKQPPSLMKSDPKLANRLAKQIKNKTPSDVSTRGMFSPGPEFKITTMQN
jgi:hypothetical protein